MIAEGVNFSLKIDGFSKNSFMCDMFNSILFEVWIIWIVQGLYCVSPGVKRKTCSLFS